MDIGFPELTFIIPFALIFVFELAMLISAITNKKLVASEKAVWLLLILFIPGFMSLAYYFMVYRKKAKHKHVVQ